MKNVRIFGTFYLLYFSWILAIIFLSDKIEILNIFSAIVALFYMIFLREKWDLLLFIAGVVAPFIIIYFSLEGPEIIDLIKTNFHPWIHLAWGTSVVAAHKLSNMAVRGKFSPIS